MTAPRRSLAPSAAKQWMRCPAAAYDRRTVKPPLGAAALRGINMHKAAAQLLMNQQLTVELTPEDSRIVSDYITYVDEIHAHIGGGVIHPERRLHNVDGYPAIVDVLIDNEDCTAVIDLKCGHTCVSAKDNEQLLMYVYILSKVKQFDDSHRFWLVIRQHCRADTWVTVWADLRQCMNRIDYAIGQSLQFPDKTVTGPHCLYCRNMTVCQACWNDVTGVLRCVDDLSALPELPDKVGMLKLVRQGSKLCKALDVKLTEECKYRIDKGEVLEGCRMDRKENGRCWRSDLSPEQITAVCKLHKVDVSQKGKLITPLQALAKGLPTDVVESLSDTRITTTVELED